MAVSAPNTTCDIYRNGNAPPAAPDIAAVPCYFVACYDLGRERGERENIQRRFVARMSVNPTVDIRDPFTQWTTQANTADTVYVPNMNGIAYNVVFVERKAKGLPDDQLVVYLDRQGINWPWPGVGGQPGNIQPPPAPPTPPGGSLQLEPGMGPSQPISTLNSAGGLTGTELAVIVQSGQDVSLTLNALAAFMSTVATILGTQVQYNDGNPLMDSFDDLLDASGNVLADNAGGTYLGVSNVFDSSQAIGAKDDILISGHGPAHWGTPQTIGLLQGHQYGSETNIVPVNFSIGTLSTTTNCILQFIGEIVTPATSGNITVTVTWNGRYGTPSYTSAPLDVSTNGSLGFLLPMTPKASTTIFFTINFNSVVGTPIWSCSATLFQSF